MIRALVVALAIGGVARAAAAEDVVVARTGLDHGLVLEVGYRRVARWREHRVTLGGDVAIPWAHPDLSDHQLRVVAAATLLPDRGRRWQVIGALRPTLRSSHNPVAATTALGADLRVTAGYFGRAWCAAELGVDWVGTAHIRHTDAYRTTVFADAKDGWYGNPGGTIYAGVETGVSFRTLDVVLRVGHPRTTDLAPQLLPVYALVGVNVKLPR